MSQLISQGETAGRQRGKGARATVSIVVKTLMGSGSQDGVHGPQVAVLSGGAEFWRAK